MCIQMWAKHKAVTIADTLNASREGGKKVTPAMVYAAVRRSRAASERELERLEATGDIESAKKLRSRMVALLPEQKTVDENSLDADILAIIYAPIKSEVAP
ncbi:hypothetical protein ThimaDRAFT_2210 [Thiocapsa marina 5811]|uniref:Uncharacterized protein n=2 Tax=Thiocapsa marina TaxID=244573 RepID=F9UAP0_9GAMM|nr:hypothetical protein ThimaDRAFT_2210 [Thiocapsa marina 5811]